MVQWMLVFHTSSICKCFWFMDLTCSIIRHDVEVYPVDKPRVLAYIIPIKEHGESHPLKNATPLYDGDFVDHCLASVSPTTSWSYGLAKQWHLRWSVSLDGMQRRWTLSISSLTMITLAEPTTMTFWLHRDSCFPPEDELTMFKVNLYGCNSVIAIIYQLV